MLFRTFVIAFFPGVFIRTIATLFRFFLTVSFF